MNRAEHTANVGTVSNRVEQAKATAARINRANKMSTAAGTMRQSTVATSPKARSSCTKRWMPSTDSVVNRMKVNTASETNPRRRKKLKNPATA